MSEIRKSDAIIEVNIDQIRVSPFQPRKVFTDEELDDLIVSIQSVGLIHPPLVREIRSGDRVLYYELIAGERRWRALQKAGFSTISVVVAHLSDDVAAEATLIENIQRVDLNPMEMAEAFKRLIDVFGLTQDKVALKVGKKRSTVANYLRLLTLPESIRTQIHLGQVTLGHAKVILSLEDRSLREILSERIIAKRLAVREAELEAKQLLNEKEKTCDLKQKKEEKGISASIKNIEQKLAQDMNCRVKIHHRGSRYCVSFYLQNEDELKQLGRYLQSCESVQ